MEKVVFAVYHDLASEARSDEMLQALELYYKNITCICRGKPIRQSNTTFVQIKKCSLSYFEFLVKTVQIINKADSNVVVLHDEFTAPLISLAKRKGAYVCYDSSELNIGRKLTSKKNNLWKILSKIEKRKLRLADLVFAANVERAKLMKEYFCLNRQAHVFDNIHRIDDEYDEVECKNKFGEYICRPFVIYGGGISDKRYTYELVKDFLGHNDINLLIAGAATEDDRTKFYSTIEQNNADNIFYLGFIARAELKFLMKNAIASYVLFKADCPNTEYCASGKMYESLFLGTPIICSDNPPLRRVCHEYNVGISVKPGEFYDAAREIISNKDFYRENAIKFSEALAYDSRIPELGKYIADNIASNKHSGK